MYELGCSVNDGEVGIVETGGDGGIDGWNTFLGIAR